MKIPMSQHRRSNCKITWVLFYYSEDCKEVPNKLPPPPPPPPPPPALPPPDYGTTLIRVTIGAHESQDMGGSLPAVALFDEFGVRIGQTQSIAKKTIGGSFRDILVKHKKEMENVRPTYLALNSGENSICISTLAIEYPDGGKQVISGDDLAHCGPQMGTAHSRTFVSSGQEQPQCFWLWGEKTSTDGNQRWSFHLPDWVWNNARRMAYMKNKELLCRQTPRLWKSAGHGKRVDISLPIAIFNPPIEYNQTTHFDTDPDRVLRWAFGPGVARDLSDHPFVVRSSQPKREIENDTLPDFGTDLDFAVFAQQLDDFPQVQPAEEDHIRTESPQLVLSNGDISAQHQCVWGEWNNTDYVSLTEKIYCDMQSRSMFVICDDEITHHCWNPETQRLQGYESSLEMPSKNIGGYGSNVAAALAPVWRTTGPLFDYAYQNITLIA